MFNNRFDEVIYPDLVLLADRASGFVHLLNRTAGFIWCHLADGMTVAECVSQISSSFGLEAENVLRDVHFVIEMLAPKSEEGRPFWTELEAKTETQLPCKVRLSFGGESVDILADEETASLVERPFRHLRASEKQATHFDLAIYSSDEDLWLVKNRAEISPRFRKSHLIPVLLASFQLLRNEISASCIRLHAACLTRNGRTAFICGASGSGKSTLSAALAGCGYSVLTDDISHVDRNGFVCSFPAAQSIKNGAWDILSPYRPDLAFLPVFERPDGKLVKLSSNGFAPAGTTHRPDSIVFVTHGTERTEMRELARVEALEQLASASVYLPPDWPLTGFVDWFSGLRAYLLESRDISEAIDALGEILSAG